MPKGIYNHIPHAGTFKKGRTSYMKGKKHSKEAIKKMSDTAKKAGTGKWMKGKRQSPEWVKNRIDNKGEKHWNWKGGITPILTKIRFSDEGKNWTKDCMIRDNFTCQKCHIKNGKGIGKTIWLQVHHIVNFAEVPELRFVINNGITLCKKCHKNFHSIYGIKNNNHEQINEYIKL
jgi:hypothetical protein